MLSTIKQFFLICSGANQQILMRQDCFIEHNKYAGIGATIFFTAILAAISGSYALFTVFNSAFIAVCFGALWGLIIFNLDRYIVSTMKKEYISPDAARRERIEARINEFSHALPRLILAVFIS